MRWVVDKGSMFIGMGRVAFYLLLQHPCTSLLARRSSRAPLTSASTTARVAAPPSDDCHVVWDSIVAGSWGGGRARWGGVAWRARERGERGLGGERRP